MTIEFDRYAIERSIRNYSNDILTAFDSPMPADAATKQNAISRAQSMLSDWAYLEQVVADLRDQVKAAGRG